jgi:pyruvate dehydrogenase E2 component (dihydrolipoamide acetyltransferase)
MARRRANELAIDLQALTGTGRDGAIELRDVEQAFAAREKNTTANPTVTSPGPSLINVRAAIAQVMTRSKREIPHYYLQSQLSMDKLIQWLDNKNRQLAPEQRLLMPAVLMRAIVLALKANPVLNGSYENGVFTPRTEIHLGITVALKPEGVMTPAILDAQQLSLAELNSAFSDLVQRTRQVKLRNREMTEATVTVTNLGDLGADTVNGIIFAPQVALIGLGRIHQAAIVDADGGLRAGYVINASLAADHRVTDGLTGSKLLNSLGRLINQPEQLE